MSDTLTIIVTLRQTMVELVLKLARQSYGWDVRFSNIIFLIKYYVIMNFINLV